jgi:dihydroflavonol-4-reductase
MWIVTGATGHIGNVLVRKLLERGEKVRALIMPSESRAPLQGLALELQEGDVLDLESLARSFHGVRGVFHLAGIISIMPGKDPWLHAVNVEGTRNVIKAAQACGVERLVFTSSIHAFQRVHAGIIEESLPFDPGNPYGAYDRSKAQATLEVIQAARAGLETVVACPTGVIGPYDFRGSLMGDVIRMAALQKPTFYVDGAYDFVDVRDIADGLIGAAEHGTRGESYILSGQRISVRYLLETVREITGKGFMLLKVPFELARLAARFMPFYYRWAKAVPRFTPYSLEVLHSNSNISHAKATRELGYQPRSLYETITDTIKWFLNSHAALTWQS